MAGRGGSGAGVRLSSAGCVSAACPGPSQGTLSRSSTHTAPSSTQERHRPIPVSPPVSQHPPGPARPQVPSPDLNAPAAPKLLQHPLNCSKCPSSLLDAPAFPQVLQHPSNTSVFPPPASLQCSSIPQNTPAPPRQTLECLCKCSSICTNIPAHQKAPASPQHQAVMPPLPGPHWAQLLVTFGVATAQLGREGSGWERGHGHGRTGHSHGRTGHGHGRTGQCPCPLPGRCPGAGRRRCRRRCCPGSGPDPAAGRRVRTSGRREEGQVQGKMPSSWKRPSRPRLGWKKPQHPSCATAAPGRGN